MNKKQIIIGSVVLVVLTISFFVVQDTLAKYRKKVDENISLGLARWDIKLNNERIAGKESITSDVTPIFEESDYVAENVIAPGITGYYDIVIDATEVDVSFSYKLTSIVNEVEKYPDIVAYGYTIDPDNNEEISNYEETGIEGTIAHNTEETKIRVYIKWQDDEGNAMDNAEDTALAISKSSIEMHSTFNFTQIKE